MTQTCCGYNHQVSGWQAVWTDVDMHRRAAIGHHPRGVDGGKAAHAGDALHIAIDRHGYLYCLSAPRTRGKQFPISAIKRIRNKELPIREAWITTTLSVRVR